MRRNSSSSISGCSLAGFGLDGFQAGVVAFFLAHLEQLGVVGQLGW